jgi:hypothetical protein
VNENEAPAVQQFAIGQPPAFVFEAFVVLQYDHKCNRRSQVENELPDVWETACEAVESVRDDAVQTWSRRGCIDHLGCELA